VTVFMDILDENICEDIIQHSCERAHTDPEKILIAHESTPCRSFTITGHSNKGRQLKNGPPGHGFNMRNMDAERTPCCPEEANCKYATIAREHDKFVPALFKSVAKDRQRGLTYACDIECVDGDLKHRPYFKFADESPDGKMERNSPFYYRPFHGCAFLHPTRAKKPYSFWTTMESYYPTGTTGTGQCEEECHNGFRNNIGKWEHIGKLGRQPKDGPRGPGAIKMKNAVPAMFLYEYARHIMAQNPNPEQNTVLDLCCGWQSWQPVCEELGLNYIGVDVRGDRNVQLNRRYA